jgi:hypothetical protein
MFGAPYSQWLSASASISAMTSIERVSATSGGNEWEGGTGHVWCARKQKAIRAFQMEEQRILVPLGL